MKSIESQILIQVPISEVWNSLLNFEEYPSWNPLFSWMNSIPERDKNIIVTLYFDSEIIGSYVDGDDEKYGYMISNMPPRIKKLSHKVVEFEKEKRLSLEQNNWLKGLSYQHLTFFMEATSPNQTAFSFHFLLGGLMSQFMSQAFFDAYSLALTTAFNECLKNWLEENNPT